MTRCIAFSFVLVLALAFGVSCSGGSGDAIAPDTIGGVGSSEMGTIATGESGTTVCLGLWQFTADKASGNVDVVQLRRADSIINVLGFMEPPPLTSMNLDWPDLYIDFEKGTVDVGVILKHPFPGDNIFTGFDVRGVCFGPVVTNADGLTIIPGPEFFKGVPFGYKDGLLGAPDSGVNYEGLAGYKYFCDGLGEDDDPAEFFSDPGNLAGRGSFTSGDHQRNYHLDWNDTGLDILVFNYAIYANYDWPVGDPPITLDSFPISTANSAEAFCISITELKNSLYYIGGAGGGEISIRAEVWDWQGNIENVSLDFQWDSLPPSQHDAALSLVGPGATGYSSIYEALDVPFTPGATGALDILITAMDPRTFGECWFLNLLPSGNPMYGKQVYSCWIHTTTVDACPEVEIGELDPWYADQGESVNDVIITGSGFLDGASKDVRLKRSGEGDIIASDIQILDFTTITVDFNLSGAEIGGWDVVITNGCDEVGIKEEGFWVIDPNCPSPTIATHPGIDPYEGDQGEIVHVEISGTNFVPGPLKEVRLTDAPPGQGTKDDIICEITLYSETLIEADFDIRTAAIGVWTVRVTNGCGEWAERGPPSGGFRVWCPVPTVDPDGINPDEGEQNTTVTVTFTGISFKPDLITDPESARMHKNGVWIDGDIDFANTTNTTLKADFDIPEDAEVGPWDIYIRNSCGTGDSFPIYGGFNVTGCNPPELNLWNAIVPGNTQNGPAFSADINGRKLFQGDEDFEVWLIEDGGTFRIDATNETWVSDALVECDLDIPDTAPYGDYDLHVKNGCGDEGMRENAFEVLPVVSSINPNSGSQGSFIDDATVTGWLLDDGFIDIGLVRFTTWPAYEVIYGTDAHFINSTTITMDLDLTGATIADDWFVAVQYGPGEEDVYGGGSFEVTPP